MQQGPEYREMRRDHKVLAYLRVHWDMFSQITPELQPGKNTWYRLFESTQGPKHYLLSIEDKYQSNVFVSELDDSSSDSFEEAAEHISPIKKQLAISEALMYQLKQLCQDILEKPYASLKSPNHREQFRSRLLSLPKKQRIEALKSQSNEDLDRLGQSMEKCLQAHKANTDMKEPRWTDGLYALFEVQREINEAKDKFVSLYERAFGVRP